jgi:hypothetical protein
MINESFSSISTCCLNNETKQFNPKQSTLSVILLIDNSPKNGGSFNLDLCSVLSPFNYQLGGSKIFEGELIRAAVPGSTIVFKLIASYIQ